jgi:phosphocarrier protein
MKSIQYTVNDLLGIHARPAGLLVKECNQFSSTITMIKGDKTADCKKILGLMSLAVKQNDTIEVNIEGSDEDTAANAVEAFLKQNL